MEIFKLFGSIFINNEEADQSIAKTEEKGQKMGLSLGEAFGNIGKAALAMGTAIVGASTAIVGGMMAMANDTAAYADEIDKLSERTGINREELQRWKYAADQSGADVGKLETGIKKLSDVMDSATKGGKAQSEAFEKLGISIEDLQTQSQEEIFERVITELAEMEQGAERNALGNDLLGKSYTELLPLINAGADGISELKDRADELGLVMSEDAIMAGVTFGDTMDDVQAVLGSLGRSIGSAVMPKLTELLNFVLDNMPTIQGYIDQFAVVAEQALAFVIDNVLPLLKDGITWIIDNLDILTPLVIGIGTAFIAWNVVTMIQGVIGAIKALTLATEGTTIAQQAMNLVMASNPVGIVISVIAALAAALIYLWNTNDDFRAAVVEAWEAVSAKAQEVWGRISDFFTKDIPAAIDGLIAFFSNFPENIGKVLGFVVGKFIAFQTELRQFLVDKAVEALNWLIDEFQQLPGRIWGALLWVVEKVVEWGPKLVEAGEAEIGKFVDKVVELALGLPGKMLEVGGQVIDGLVQGIKGGFDAAMGAVGGFFGGIVQGAKDALGIKSPSKVFADEVGKQIALGVTEGINKEADKAAEAAAKLSRETYSKAKLWIDDYRNDAEYMAKEEITMWQTLRDTYKDNIEMRIEVDKNINRLRDEEERRSFNHSKDWIEAKKRLQELSADDEIAAWERVQSRYTEGTELRKKADEELYKTQERMRQEEEKAAVAAQKAAEEAAKAQQKLVEDQEKLMQRLADAENKYQGAVESRSEAIAKSFGIFNELKEKEAASSIALMTNLSSQVDAMKQWATDLAGLAAKGIEEGLLQQLREMGPQAYAEIAALNTMTEEELAKYSELWKEKNELAKTAAVEELQKLRTSTNEELTKLSEEMATLTGDSITPIGQEMIQGITEGVIGETGELDSAINEALVINPEIETNKLIDMTKSKLAIYLDLWKKAYADLRRAVASALTEIRALSDSEMTKLLQSLQSIVNSMAYPIGVSLGQLLGQGLISQEAALYEQAQRIAASIRAAFALSSTAAPSSAPLPSHQAGLDYVPYDGYAAVLHKGEGVLTAQENREYQQTGEQTVVVNQYFYGVKEEQTAFEVKRAAEKAAREVL